MKRAFVCGAGGFIASHLVGRLKAEGYWVRGVDSKHPEFSPSADARGAAHRESDVDVAVLFDHAAIPDRRERGRRAVRLSAHLVAETHCNAVDVAVLNDAPPELAVAAASGLRLYCADPERDHAFRRTAMSRLADVRPFLERTRRLKLEALAR